MRTWMVGRTVRDPAREVEREPAG